MSQLGARKTLALALVLGSAAACRGAPQDKRVEMAASEGAEVSDETRGTVVLAFSDPVQGLTVAVNGELVADGIRTGRLTIDGIEVGYADVAVAGRSVERQVRVWVSPDRPTFVPIASAPRPERRNPLVAAALSLVALVVSQSVNNWLF